MARKFGKRGKSGGRGGADPRDLFGPPSLPRHSSRPASSTPLADHLDQGWPGVDQGYVVLPRSIVESMSLPWQQQMTNLLAQFHEQHRQLPWPEYRVVPSRYERLVDLDEEQLAEAGYLVEIDAEGQLVYRERSGRKVTDPQETTVLVSCLDPVVKREVAPPRQSGVPTQQRRAGQRPPAPMNIGPQPVWHPVPDASADGLVPPATGAGQAASPAQPAAEQLKSGQEDMPAPRGGPAQPWSGNPASQNRTGGFGPTGEPTELPYRHPG